MARAFSSNMLSKFIRVRARRRSDGTRRIEGFHSTWVEIRTLAALDAVETVDVVVVAEEVEAEVPMRPCLGRHLKWGPARNLKATFLPLALATRARMETC